MSHSVAYKLHWTEPRVEPLVMTDTEILDWMSEYFDEIVYVGPTEFSNGGFTLHCYGIKTNAPVLREVVQLAAAKYQQENE
jgi:hypothetical protein